MSRFERMAGYFILLSLVPIYFLWVRPGYEDESWFGFGPRLFVVNIRADSGLDLAVGDKVTMQGIQVGEVEKLELVEVRDEGTNTRVQKVEIKASIYSRYEDKITDESIFYLFPPPVVGSGHIEVEAGQGTPLRSGETVIGQIKPSLEDKAEEILEHVGGLLIDASERVNQLEVTLNEFRKILTFINEGKGSMGKFVYEEEFYQRLSLLVTRLESSAQLVDELQSPVRDLAERFPEFMTTVLGMSQRLDQILANLEEGMAFFPTMATKIVVALTEGRKVLESLKRNFLIRGNLPRESTPEGMAPSSGRAPLPGGR